MGDQSPGITSQSDPLVLPRLLGAELYHCQGICKELLRPNFSIQVGRVGLPAHCPNSQAGPKPG